MIQLSNESLYEIITRSLNRMNDLLVGHGERVAYGVMCFLEQDGRFSENEIGQIVWTILFHDVGSFRKTDTWNVVQLDTEENCPHAIYGFLFLKTFFPFSQYASIVRYHHASDAEIANAGVDEKLGWLMKCLRVVDETDLVFIKHGRGNMDAVKYFFRERSRKMFPAEEPLQFEEFSVMQDMDAIHSLLLKRMRKMTLSSAEKEALLRTLVCSMDFRSHYTALHCSMMVRASDMLADYFDLDEDVKNAVHVGAILHDLGKSQYRRDFGVPWKARRPCVGNYEIPCYDYGGYSQRVCQR